MCQSNHVYQSIADQACAVIASMLLLKPSYRARELARHGWGSPHQVAKSRGYTRAKGLKRAPAWETHSALYTCAVMRDYLLGEGLIKVNRGGAMRLVNRVKAQAWLVATLARENTMGRHGWAIQHLLSNEVIGLVADAMPGVRFKVEVIADDSGNWASNAVEHETRELAEVAARDLRSRWMMVREWRVVRVERDEDGS